MQLNTSVTTCARRSVWLTEKFGRACTDREHELDCGLRLKFLGVREGCGS